MHFSRGIPRTQFASPLLSVYQRARLTTPHVPFFISPLALSLSSSSSSSSFSSLLSFSPILICFARPRGARDGIYLAARTDFPQSFGR